MALFPPGKGGGQGVARGHKGKGVTIHLVVDAQGAPLAFRVTAANVDECSQVCDMLDCIKALSGHKGRARKRPKQLAADKG